jgi:hypothetical protein
MAEHAASRLVGGSGQSLDPGGGEDRRFPSESSPLRLVQDGISDWPCGCGQEYRVLSEPLTFWPRNSRRGFRTDPTEACVACGADLEEVYALEAARAVSAAILR